METTTLIPTQRSSRLERPTAGRVLGGVASGLAQSTGIPVWLIRLGFVATSFLGGLGLLLYAGGWVLLPSSDRSQSPAQRWLDDLSTPGRRTGAVIIALAALVLLTPMAPTAVVAAAVLLVIGVSLARSPSTEDK